MAKLLFGSQYFREKERRELLAPVNLDNNLKRENARLRAEAQAFEEETQQLRREIETLKTELKQRDDTERRVRKRIELVLPLLRQKKARTIDDSDDTIEWAESLAQRDLDDEVLDLRNYDFELDDGDQGSKEDESDRRRDAEGEDEKIKRTSRKSENTRNFGKNPPEKNAMIERDSKKEHSMKVAPKTVSPIRNGRKERLADRVLRLNEQAKRPVLGNITNKTAKREKDMFDFIEKDELMTQVKRKRKPLLEIED